MMSSSLSPAAAAFDRLSDRYARACDNAIFEWMRARVHASWARSIPPGARVLEIGCGAGIDTVFLAARGAEVTALDPAPGMLRETGARLERERPARPVRLVEAGLEHADEALDRAGEAGRFDAIVSNFGALNCAISLQPLRQLAERRLERGGVVSLGLMSRTCAWEIACYLAKLRPREAFRRAGRGARMVTVEGIPVPTVYHRAADVRAALGPGFEIRRLDGLAVLVPPPFLAHRWAAVPAPVRRAVTALDAALSPRVPFNRLGDHFLIELVRR